MKTAESDLPTPYAIRCYRCSHGNLVFMCKEFYMDQLMAADSKWVCPICFQEATWDDKNYDDFYFKEIDEIDNTSSL
jgi:hypothetical protein